MEELSASRFTALSQGAEFQVHPFPDCAPFAAVSVKTAYFSSDNYCRAVLQALPGL